MGHSLACSDAQSAALLYSGSTHDSVIEHYAYLSEIESGGTSCTGVVSMSSPVVSPRVRSLHHDMQALRMSRQDNPYIQQKLDRVSVNVEKDTPFSSPRKQEQEKLVDDSESEDSSMSDDEEGIINLHQHLIRSPPPHFPQNVTKFRFPDTRSSPIIGKQDNSVYDPTPPSGRSATPAHIALEHATNNKITAKETMPLLPIDEKSQFGPQHDCGELSLTFDHRQVPSSEAEGIERERAIFMGLNRTQGNPQVANIIGGEHLNPIVIKSGVDILDPRMREVLEFQKHKIVHETGLRLPEPLGTAAIGATEVTVPVITGRSSVEGNMPTSSHNLANVTTQRGSIGSSNSYAAVRSLHLQMLQPMAPSGGPPSTAPSLMTSPTRMPRPPLPRKSLPGMTSPPASTSSTTIFSPLPPLGATANFSQHSMDLQKSQTQSIETISKGVSEHRN